MSCSATFRPCRPATKSGRFCAPPRCRWTCRAAPPAAWPAWFLRAVRWPAATWARLGSGAVDLGYATLLKAFAPPAAILVNASHQLVHSYGEVHAFLRIREGQASLDINRILPDALIPVAAALLFKCARENTSVTSDVVRLSLPPTLPEQEAHRINSSLSAWPAGEVEGERLTLLAFEPSSSADRADKPVPVDIGSETSERLEVLEHELAATRESLQATIEGAGNLQRRTPGHQRGNDGLQRGAAKLERRAAIGERGAEHRQRRVPGKIDILNRVNADLDNLARVVSSGTVFVDEHLNLTRFSPDAAQIFRLRDTDAGRPLDDLTHSLDYPDFMTDLRHTCCAASPTRKKCAAPNSATTW